MCKEKDHKTIEEIINYLCLWLIGVAVVLGSIAYVTYVYNHHPVKGSIIIKVDPIKDCNDIDRIKKLTTY